MKPICFVGICLCIATLAFAAVAQQEEQQKRDSAGPAADIPQLQALDHYRGTWDCTMTMKSAPDQDEPEEITGTVEARWILNGRFMEQNITLQPAGGGDFPGLKMKTLMTYDVPKSEYQSWSFVANGSTSQSTGTWDEAAQTMTSITHDADAGITSTVTADFSQQDTENWTIILVNDQGETVLEITGQNTRKAD